MTIFAKMVSFLENGTIFGNGIIFQEMVSFLPFSKMQKCKNDSIFLGIEKATSTPS